MDVCAHDGAGVEVTLVLVSLLVLTNTVMGAGAILLAGSGCYCC